MRRRNRFVIGEREAPGQSLGGTAGLMAAAKNLRVVEDPVDLAGLVSCTPQLAGSPNEESQLKRNWVFPPTNADRSGWNRPHLFAVPCLPPTLAHETQQHPPAPAGCSSDRSLRRLLRNRLTSIPSPPPRLSSTRLSTPRRKPPPPRRRPKPSPRPPPQHPPPPPRKRAPR